MHIGDSLVPIPQSPKYLSRCKHFRGVLEENASLGFISVSVLEPNERTVLIENYKLLPPGLSEKSL